MRLKQWASLSILVQTALSISTAAPATPQPAPTLDPAAATTPPSDATNRPTPTSTAAISVVTYPNGVKFPKVGSVPEDFSPAGLQNIWNIVGNVQPPPFTTTRVPQLPIPVPSAPPALFPSWYAPDPSKILPNLSLPKGFFFGVATAAYQVEGAAANDGKGPSIWDWNGRQPNGVSDNTTGDVVDLHYYLYKEDVARVAALGVNAHSFSISWARIYPFGTADSPVSQAGLKHYSDVIDAHIAAGVAPVVTLFHWDTPLALHAYYGGFTSPRSVDDFVQYAKTVFKAYNGRVKTGTLSTSREFTVDNSLDVTLAPGVNATSAPFHCAYNVLRAHAGAVKAFREMKIQGEIAFKNDDFVGIPWRSNSTEDTQAVERHAAFQLGIYCDPVYKTGDWPKLMTDVLSPDILPRFTAQEKKDLLGSADFFAIDSYRTSYVRAPAGGIAACVANPAHPDWPACNEPVLFDSSAGWAAGFNPDPASDSWLQGTPNFLRQSLRELQTRWPTKKMYISEFGFDEPFEELRTDIFRITEDLARTTYYMTYMGEVLLAIHEDNIPIAGVFAWAMMDNAEWSSGLAAKFGIQYVNYTTLERTYKRSALSLSEFFKGRL